MEVNTSHTGNLYCRTVGIQIPDIKTKEPLDFGTIQFSVIEWPVQPLSHSKSGPDKKIMESWTVFY
jgi:hypothetical protein